MRRRTYGVIASTASSAKLHAVRQFSRAVAATAFGNNPKTGQPFFDGSTSQRVRGLRQHAMRRFCTSLAVPAPEASGSVLPRTLAGVRAERFLSPRAAVPKSIAGAPGRRVSISRTGPVLNSGKVGYPFAFSSCAGGCGAPRIAAAARTGNRPASGSGSEEIN